MKKQLNIYTDLALEAAGDCADKIDGVTIATEKNNAAQLTITTVDITSDDASQNLNKPIGTYVTLESKLLMENDPTAHEIIIKEFSRKLGQFHKLDKDDVVLVVGLGNWNVTPDALGPKSVARVLVTRHITGTDAVALEIENQVRSVCAVTPGVMGITGIETGDIVRGIVDKICPDLVIAIDALAARSISRINSTIQMSDTGVNPGAGLGNKRKELNQKTLGVPVIAIGVPTVVDAATLISDTLDVILEDMINHSGDKNFLSAINSLDDKERYAMVAQALEPYTGNMFVTPKDVDAVMTRLASIIANSINIALHPGITQNDINKFF